MIKRIALFLLACVFILSPVAAKKPKKTKPFVPVAASIVMEAETGKILHQENASTITHPASLTKMMSLILIFQALEEKKIKFSTKMPVSRLAADQPPTKLGLRKGQNIRVMDAILGMITKSANDASVTFAEYLAGSETAFVAQMNRKAKSLGMTQTVFANCHGLPPKGKSNKAQVTSARDMAILARHLYKRFPNYYRYFRTRSFIYEGQVHRNHNHLLGTVAGVDGIKTGFICASGFNIAVSAKRDGVRLIAVVMGGQTYKQRDNKMIALLDRMFAKDLTAFLKPGQKVIPEESIVDEVLTAQTHGSQEDRGEVRQSHDESSLDTLIASLPEGTGQPFEMNESLKGQKVAMAQMQNASVHEEDEIMPEEDEAPNEKPAPTPVVQTVKLTKVQPNVKTSASKDWMVQLGVYGRAQFAKDRLWAVRKKLDGLPGREAIEKKSRKRKPLYQAQVKSLTESEAKGLCRDLKEGGDVCLALKVQRPKIHVAGAHR